MAKIDSEYCDLFISERSDRDHKFWKIGHGCLKIKHKDTGEEITVNFGVSDFNDDDLKNALYSRESKKLFDYVDKTMGGEELLKSEERKQSTLKKYNDFLILSS